MSEDSKKQSSSDSKTPSAPSKSIEELLKLLSMGQELTPAQQKEMKDYKFWKTQPVPALNETITEEGPIDKLKTPADIPDDPLPLIKEFEWSTLDIDNEKELDELYSLLYENYVEDVDASFRFKYSREFFQWALKPPGWRKDWHVGIRVKATGRLVCFIAATPVTIRLNKSDKVIDNVEINFLCIHKKLRNKRLAPVLIKEITRRVNKQDIWQALYTGGAILPTPLATCRYQHRPINWSKLHDVGFSHLPANETKTSMVAKHTLPNATQLPGLRPMTEEDITPVLSLLYKYQKKFDIVQEFTEEEFKHWMLGNNPEKGTSNVIKSFVVENDKGEITDYFSYYLLPFTVLENAHHDELGIAYLFYYATDSSETPEYKTRLNDLINDALITSKKFNVDVFNCLTCQDNTYFLKNLKFGSGDGFLNYYLFNYRTFPMNGGIDKDSKDVLEDQTSGIGVVLFKHLINSNHAMISSSTWVPRGYASEFPEKYELDDEEMERINAMANLEINDAREQLAQAQAEEQEMESPEEDNEEESTKTSNLKEQIEIDDDLKEYDLENYDNDDDGLEGEQVTFIPGLTHTDAKMLKDEDGEGDMYLSLPTEVDLDEEKKENQIYPTDNLVLATRTEDDISYLDVYIYDNGAYDEEKDKLDPDVARGLVREASLYVHHDVMLPAFPLCVEWINYRPGQESAENNIGNFAAVGSLDPQIEIWNLDFVDKAFPDIILGEPSQNSFTAKKNKKSKKKKSNQHITTHHIDAVLSLSHNRTHRSVLASTSADKTVKLWDLNSGTAVRSFDNIHAHKIVSSSQWHAQEASILLTGGYDSTAALTDVRISTDDSSKHYGVSSGEEIETVRWDPTRQEVFYVGTDNGNIYSFDIREESKPLWTLHAHDAGISSLDIHNTVLASGSSQEKVIKLWDVKENPSMVLSRDFDVGNVLTASFAPDAEVASKLVVGGAGSVEVKIIDIENL